MDGVLAPPLRAPAVVRRWAVAPARAVYLALALLLFALLLGRTSNQLWAGDFWEHAAVVRELAAHPLQPAHPILLLEAPHAFYSPYAVSVGLLARAAGQDAIAALSAAGMVNLVLILAGLFLLAAQLPGGTLTACIALVLMLLAWNDRSFDLSGFFHFNALARNLPYPSSFAMALTLAALAAAIAYIRNGRWVLVPLIGLATWIVLLTHPTTALMLAAGLLAFNIGYFRRDHLARYTVLAAGLGLAVALTLAWPYYPFLTLLRTPDPEFHRASQVLYDGALSRWYLLLFVLPVVALRLRRNWRDPLALAFLILGTLYVLGGALGQYGYGRTIAAILIFGYLMVAELVASVLQRRAGRLDRWLAGVVALAMGVQVWLALPSTWRLVLECIPGRESSYGHLTFLSRWVGQYDVVMSDSKTALMVPALAGKVIFFPRPMHFISDASARRADLERFFGDATPTSERAELLKRYRARWLLIDATGSAVTSSEARAYNDLGKVVYEDRRRKLTLIQLDDVEAGASGTFLARHTGPRH